MLLLLLCVLQSFSLSMRRVDLVVRRGSVCMFAVRTLVFVRNSIVHVYSVHYALIPYDLIVNYCVYTLCLFFGTD